MQFVHLKKFLFQQNRLNLLIKNALSTTSSKYSYTKSMYFADQIDPNETKLNKILIANRGEIACRIIQTCREMGIKTVAIYSDIDYTSMHVQNADEAYCVGSASSNESYLNVPAILNVIKQTKTEAVHPGYGFLSENTLFAQKLNDMGVVFIGPNSNSIHSMGDKIESKFIANRAGVNTIPGFDGIVRDADHCVRLANEIGYPVMIKASAGGGGKGMRMASNDREAHEGFRFSTNEAVSSFNDDKILIEKFIENPRHIEMQVLCDQHGNAIHLNERECSIQRRNQKVIEEAPSAFLDSRLRAEMGQQAISLARNVNYDSVGTVEFLVDKSRNFYFLEMNTRLQVEHPITEYTCGIDLVHQMIRVAKGHPLRHKQSDVQLRGWSIESRVYAENPMMNNFGMPSVGRLTRYEEPTNISNVRCDSGVKEGSEISIYYDPLICKLISYGETRNQALNTMKDALDNYVIRGVSSNISLLRDIITEKNFVEGNLDTNYLPTIYPDGFKGRQLSKKGLKSLVAIASVIFMRNSSRSSTSFVNANSISKLSHSCESTSCNLLVDMNANENLKDQKSISVLITKIADKYSVKFDDNEHSEVILPANFSFASMKTEFVINDNNGEKDVQTVQLIQMDHCGKLQIQFEGTPYDIAVMDSKTYKYRKFIPKKPKIDSSKIVLSPMPGLIKSVSCQVGDKVNEGQELCVIEAMKMQNSLHSTSNGIVAKINCNVGDIVDGNQVLIQLRQ